MSDKSEGKCWPSSRSIDTNILKEKRNETNTHDIVKSPKTVKPSVGSGKIGDVQIPGDGSGLSLEHWTSDSNSHVLLSGVPIPNFLIGFFITRTPRTPFTGANMRIQFRLFFIPFF